MRMSDKALRAMERVPLQYIKSDPNRGLLCSPFPRFRTRLDGRWYRQDLARSLPS